MIRRSLAILLAAALALSAAATAFAGNYTVYYYAGDADEDERVPYVCKDVDEGDIYTVLRPGSVFDDYDDYVEDGYEFYCWEDQNGKEYSPKDTVRFRNFKDGVLKLTAVWDEEDEDVGISYGVTYSAGDAGKSSVKETYSGDFEAEAPESLFADFAEFKEDGYRFVFWMDKIGNTFLEGDTVDVSEEPFNTSYNMTLTAAWLDDGDYPVFFRSGTTEAKGADPAAFYAEYDKSYTLPDNPYTLAGYSFAGWDVAGTVLRPGDKYSVRDGLIVKAVWK
ncbi:MAG TPA: InlB B-repeat-containing protein, partial [Oscillospiraceae bacterium]|nr:InlB B-repeat-containing protein [Oscillospiraceae bacterium]